MERVYGELHSYSKQSGFKYVLAPEEPNIGGRYCSYRKGGHVVVRCIFSLILLTFSQRDRLHLRRGFTWWLKVFTNIRPLRGQFIRVTIKKWSGWILSSLGV